MKHPRICTPLTMLGIAAATAFAFPAYGDAGHADGDQARQIERLQQAQEQHQEHEHGGDEFEALENISAEDIERIVGFMTDVGLALPPMDGERGRDIFLNKGCIVCHAVNDVGGLLGPSLNAADMPRPMNAFEFSARMWRGAPAMAQLQADILGDFIALSGQDLADLVAFAHDEAAQATLTADDIPERFRDLIFE